jgi:hypothetical protein
MIKIQTYEDLIKEKQQLEVLLQAQKELIRYDVSKLREQFQPAVDTISFLGKFITRDKSSAIITGGANRVIDLVFKKLILARSGWLTRMIVPFLVKNYSSHLIHDKKDRLVDKLFSWIGHKNSNGKAAPGAES